ncbi:P-loop containing nucleoside triphosphate hydrolase protein [Gilbertella persicaria]|uniref:P-loop containing nucleoside triphosphate hydrolase protein n=1 Tax=Gilbertella persicaria TaxID=101096 RepID=UPI00222080D8|nr:P-loop containing nucleoside triphosphate hydrolase protein [Gilbertella persicaria]KAI8077229.1 P-loop containing nucleoside triphosphate hydrolase protein [Gilbertella persicaria]
MMAPPENKLNNIYHSHGIEVYHKPGMYQPSDNGFNLQKLAWIEAKDNVLEPFKRVRIIHEEDDDEKSVLIEHEEDSKEEYVSKDAIYMMNPPKFDHVEDMAELLYMHEPAVVHTLTQRYKQNDIYTYSGLFLVAINPYRQLPIYSQDMIRSYRQKRRGEMPPHIYAIADHAFHDMLHDRQNQSILITGESGAGKTENTKIVIQYLTSIASSHSNTKRKTLESQILQANPILESFGNAQTIRNNNSSRFGKFIRIAFNRNGDIEGAFIDWYLLETSRVHTQSLEERNYHIFYQLMNADADMKAQLRIDQHCPADFHYTRNANHTIQGVDDAAEYKKLVHAMDIMGISSEERFEYFRIIIAVLYLGNIVVTNSYGGRVDISDYEMACELLGVSPVLFKKHVLEPQIRAGNEWVSQSKSPTQVKDNLDALAKVLYERNFGQVVRRVNSAIDGGPFFQSLVEEKRDLDGDQRYIGVLDIAGFEIFKINSFEQLCINYTNEKLQDFFNQTMFVLEEREYQREHIEWNESLDYRHDLQPTIQLIESAKNPIGILSCLEDECVTQGTDERLLAKIDEQNKSNPRFKKDIYNEGFAIKHYAGEVKYSTSGWVERGKDPLNEHVARLFSESTNQHVARLFKDYAVPTASSSSSSLRTSDLLLRNKVSSPLHYRTRKGGGNFHTVGYKHKQQLSILMNTLQTTRPHFVRCILPNDRKRPGEIQPRLILHQLRCNGVLEGIRICRVGYPNRLLFQQFREEYKLLAPELIQHERDHRKACHLLLSTVSDELSYGEHFQMGRTKVFFKAGVLGELEKKRDIQLSLIITQVQAACLGWMARRKRTERESQDKLIRTIQRNARIYIDMMQSKLWKVYYRRKELQYTFGAEDADRKKMDDLEQVLAVSQEQLKELSEEHQHQQKTIESLEEERDTWKLKSEQLQKELEEAQAKLQQVETELQTTKQFSEEQAIMLSKMHQDVQEEAEENENLMAQCDELRKQNQEFQERIEFLENDKTVSDALQAELDAKDHETRQLQQEIMLGEEQHRHELDSKQEEISCLEGELDQLRKQVLQYQGEMQEKTLAHSNIQTQFQSMETSLIKETEEKKIYQRRNIQLEKDVDMLTRLVQSEAKESRARADR